MDIPPIPVKHTPMKRLFDILFSLTALFFLSPWLFLIGIVIRCTSKGPVFYSQERVGRGGKRFRCYKLRSMYADADQRLQEILSTDELRRQEWLSTHKLRDDPRITPLGRFLRKTSLDELPQFWNVLKGDLSVVGPRPVVMQEVTHHFGESATKILSIRPGLTGKWQVSGRSDISYTTRIRLDEEYVDNHSFLLDLLLICKTVPCMLLRRGAY